MKKEIYLDHAATTPVDSAVYKKMQPYFSVKYGNPSSIHKLGDQSRQAIEKARGQVAEFLGCSTKEIYFIGSTSESDNWVIMGAIEKARARGIKKPHVITSAFEHKAILEPIRVLEKKGLIESTLLPINKDGLVEIKNLEKSIKKNTVLISVMYANSEIGTIQPIKEIGQIIGKINSKRDYPIIFHTDAVQAVNYLNCDVNYLNVNCLSFSAHKIYGPKGIGILYIREGTLLSPLIRGGGHERNMRAGTENVPGIVGLGEAVSLVSKKKKDNERIKKLRNKLITGIMKNIPGSQLNGSLEHRLPNNANISFEGVEGEGILIDLSEQGIYVSTGSACASHSLKPSHVLTAIGLSDQQAHTSIRFTLGRQTKSSDIDQVLKILTQSVSRLRKISVTLRD